MPHAFMALPAQINLPRLALPCLHLVIVVSISNKVKACHRELDEAQVMEENTTCSGVWPVCLGLFCAFDGFSTNSDFLAESREDPA